MQKWNISTYRARRVDEKNDATRLVVFTPKGLVIRMSKMAHLCTFCWIQQTISPSPSLGKISKCIRKVLFGSSTTYYGLWSSDLPLANCQHLKIQDLTIPLLIQHFLYIYFYPQYLTSSYFQSLLNITFFARIRWHLPLVLKYIAQIVTNFLLLYCCHFWHFKRQNSGSKHVEEDTFRSVNIDILIRCKIY